jgi:hypothetical protein
VRAFVSHAAENDYVEGVVCAAVTATVKAVPAGASAAGGDRRDAAEVREGGFGLDPVRVVAGTGEHLAGDLGSNARKGEQRRSDLVDQLIKLMVSLGDFL